jgi:hypothetical protein
MGDGMEAHVYPTAEYSSYVEWGTRFNGGARPFIRPAFYDQTGIFKAEMKKLMR